MSLDNCVAVITGATVILDSFASPKLAMLSFNGFCWIAPTES